MISAPVFGFGPPAPVLAMTGTVANLEQSADSKAPLTHSTSVRLGLSRTPARIARPHKSGPGVLAWGLPMLNLDHRDRHQLLALAPGRSDCYVHRCTWGGEGLRALPSIVGSSRVLCRVDARREASVELSPGEGALSVELLTIRTLPSSA